MKASLIHMDINEWSFKNPIYVSFHAASPAAAPMLTGLTII